MPAKLSEVKGTIHVYKVKNDTWNFDRKPETDEEREQQRKFEESIALNGVTEAIVISSDKDEDGLFTAGRGRRRISAVIKAIEKGKFSEKDPKAYIPYRTVIGDYWDNATRMEVVYGDNDNRKNYKPKDRQRIILERYGAKEILKNYKGGDYSSGAPKPEKDPLHNRIMRDIPTWPHYQVKRDLTALRKQLSEDSYPDLSEEKIDKLNRQFVSWWERIRSTKSLERDMKKDIERYKTQISKIKKDAATFAQGFPKGGPEAYAKNAIGSRRADFEPIRKIRGLKEFITGQEE